MSGQERDWLVDGVGEPDTAERRVEQSLRAARWRGNAEDLIERLDGEDSSARAGLGIRRRAGWPRAALLAAAGLVLVVGVWASLFGESRSGWRRGSGGSWGVGVWVETGEESEEFTAEAVGRVTVRPGSRVRLLSAGDDGHRLELAEGALEAFIYAPPRLFFVETPGATAVDMGCAYEMDVAADGSGVLRVTGGWVELQEDGPEQAAGPADGLELVSRVPAGAVCRLGVGGALGLPWFEDGGEAFGALVAGAESREPGAVGRLLSGARPRDSLTLWHLVSRTAGPERAAVVGRLAELAPPDEAGDVEAVLSADRAAAGEALERWWYGVRRSW